VQDAFADLHVVEESAVRAASVRDHPLRPAALDGGVLARDRGLGETDLGRPVAADQRPLGIDLDRVALRGAETKRHHRILRILA